MKGAKRRLLAPLVALLGAACGSSDAPVYDAPDASPWRTVRAPVVPHLAGGVAIVSELGSDSVSVLDLAGGRTLATVPVGLTPLAANGPHDLAVDAHARVFYTPLTFPPPVLVPGPHAAHGSSVTPGVLEKRSFDGFTLLGQVQVDANPGDVVASDDGSRVYVSHFDLARAIAHPGDRPSQLSRVYVIDAATMRVLAAVPVCVAGHEMELSDDGRTVYLACYGDDALAVIDVSVVPPVPVLVPIGSAVASASPVYGPYATALSPDGSTVWVVAQPPDSRGTGSGFVFAFDTATRRFDLTRTLTLHLGRPFFPDFSDDGGTMFLPVQGPDALLRVHLGTPPTITQTVSFTADQCRLPHRASTGPDGRVYVACEGLHTATQTAPSVVLGLDGVTLDPRTRFDVGVDPEDILFVE